MKILITGAAGGIGSRFVSDLKNIGHDLILVDNLRNGYLKNISEDGTEPDNFYRIDINSDDFHNLVEKEKPEIVLHLAAITSLPDCELNYRECIRVNVEGTISVLGASAKNGVKRVIFASTSAVYENTELSEDGFSENDICKPTLFYSLSKKMSEELCISYRENYGLDVLILRFFNVFGPNQDIHRKHPPLMNYIIREFMNKRVPVLYSDGDQFRDYIYVDDVVQVLSKALDLSSSFSNNYIFNLSSGKSISVKQIVNEIKKTNHDFENIDVEYQESHKLWDSYPKLFEGINSLKRSVVDKETNKKSLGNNSLSKSLLDLTIKNDTFTNIRSMAREIQNKFKF